MKITLDISKLVEEGKLTREEADRLTALAAHDTGSLGINILIGFGVVAISAGAVALVPTPLTAVIITMLIPTAIRQYSMAVAPDSSLRNLANSCSIQNSRWRAKGLSPERPAEI